MPDKTTTAGND